MAKAPARSGKPVSRRPKAPAPKVKRATKPRSKPQGIAPLPPENLALADRLAGATLARRVELVAYALEEMPFFSRMDPVI